MAVNSKKEISLRDCLFLCHPKPVDKKQVALWKRLANNELKSPDTWEVSLSAGKDKKETFTRLIKTNKLGAMAMLRNLRNMQEARVTDDVIRQGLRQMNVERVLPFRFITAAKYAPQFEPELEEAMLKSLALEEKLYGKTVVIVDVSGSMGQLLSGRGEGDRIDAAAGLVILMREICPDARIYATAGSDSTRIHQTAILPSRHGFALRDAFRDAENRLGGGGIFLTQVMNYVYDKEREADRILVFTDEQDTSGSKYDPLKANAFGNYNYLVNIASHQNGIGYGPKWTHLDGFSSAVTRWITEYERIEQ